MARAPFDTRITPEALNPQARPVDTFARVGPGNLEGLAQALAPLRRELGDWLNERTKKQADEDEARGRAGWFTEKDETIKEGTRNGKFPAQWSPAYVRGWQKSQGEGIGKDLITEFNAAFDAWDGKNTLQSDPEAANEAFNEFMEDFFAGKADSLSHLGPDALRTLTPQLEALDGMARTRWDTYRSEFVKTGAVTAGVASILKDIDTLEKEGLASPEGMNYGLVWERIQAKREEYLNSGGNPDDFDASLVKSMAVKIIATRDVGLLAFFSQKVPGKDHTYGETPEGARIKQETESTLEVIARTSQAQETAKQNAKDQADKDAAYRNTMNILAADPAAPIPDALLTEGERVDPLYRKNVEEWRASLGRGFTDPKDLKAVYAEIYSGGGRDAVLRAMEQGVFGNNDDLTKAMGIAESFENSRDRVEDAISDNLSQQFLKDLDIRTKGRTDLGDPITGTSNEGYEAQYDFRTAVTQWVTNNPNATYLERQKAITEIGKSIMDRLQFPEGATQDDVIPKEQTYERDPNAPFANPYTEGTAPAPQSQPQAAPSATPSTAPDTDSPQQPQGATRGEMTAAPAKTPDQAVADAEDTEDFLNGLSAAQRKAMESLAKDQGITLEQFVERNVMSQPAPETVKPVPAEPPSGDDYISPNQGLRDGMMDEPRPDKISYTPGGGGLANLVSSNKRGRAPDLGNLRPEVQQGVAALQQAWGRKLPIVSGFRGAARNAKAGGAKKSQHLHGNAVDIDVSDLSQDQKIALIRLASQQGFTGIGVYGKNSLHLDYGGRRAWGPTYHKESIPGWAKGVIAEHMGRGGTIRRGKKPSFQRQEAEDYITAALDQEDTTYERSNTVPQDPVASRLVDLIVEGEAGGNWNAVAGNPGSTKDLGKMTLNEVLATQAVAARRGVASTAVGGPQFVRKTLRRLKEQLGLTGNEPFNKNLQSYLAFTLLKERGYVEFREGRISQRQFAHRLSQEWAAVANPYSGQSYWAGVGNNKANIRASEVYDALGI